MCRHKHTRLWEGRVAPWLWLGCLEIALLEHGGEMERGVAWRGAPMSHALLMTTASWGRAERLAAGPSSRSAP